MQTVVEPVLPAVQGKKRETDRQCARDENIGFDRRVCLIQRRAASLGREWHSEMCFGTRVPPRVSSTP